jgi:hypothetical protein
MIGFQEIMNKKVEAWIGAAEYENWQHCASLEREE